MSIHQCRLDIVLQFHWQLLTSNRQEEGRESQGIITLKNACLVSTRSMARYLSQGVRQGSGFLKLDMDREEEEQILKCSYYRVNIGEEEGKTKSYYVNIKEWTNKKKVKLNLIIITLMSGQEYYFHIGARRG